MEKETPVGAKYILLGMKHIPPGIVCTGYYLIGIRVGEASDIFTLQNAIKVFEVPQQNGSVGFNFLSDFILTNTDCLQVPRASVAFYRMLDEKVDARIIQNLLGAIAQQRLKEAGIVPATAGQMPGPGNGVSPKDFGKGL